MIPAPALGSRGRRRIVSLAVTVLVVLGGGSRAAASPMTAAGPYRAGQVLVGYDPDVPAQERRAIARAVGARRAPGDPRLGTARRTPSSKAEGLVAASETLAVPAARVSAVVALLRRQRGVRYAEPDYLLHESASPNDPGFAMQWGFFNTGQAANGTAGSPGSDEHVTPAWSLTTGSRSVVVAELDSGVDYNHPDLAANVWTNDGTVGGCPAGTHGYNVVASTCDPMDDETPYRGHGTHVAGILGAVGNNGVGVTGVNWATTILPVKWTNSAGDGSTSQLLTALDWVVKAKQAGVNVRVVNDSVTYKGTASSQALSDRIDLLAANDILFVTSAGNTGDNNDDLTVGRYPCRYGRANEICVTASDQQDRLPSWANYGPGTVDLAAPGDQIYSTLRGGAYGYISGGSMASPQVAGAAALILSRGYRSATALKADILDHVDPIPALAGRVRTGGRLDICRAMGGCPDSTAPSVARHTAAGTALLARAGGRLAVHLHRRGGRLGHFGVRRAGERRHLHRRHEDFHGEHARPGRELEHRGRHLCRRSVAEWRYHGRGPTAARHRNGADAHRCGSRPAERRDSRARKRSARQQRCAGELGCRCRGAEPAVASGARPERARYRREAPALRAPVQPLRLRPAHHRAGHLGRARQDPQLPTPKDRPRAGHADPGAARLGSSRAQGLSEGASVGRREQAPSSAHRHHRRSVDRCAAAAGSDGLHSREERGKTVGPIAHALSSGLSTGRARSGDAEVGA